MAFPEGFLWGVAAASYQVEGGAYADDKGLSTWDMFSRRPGKVLNGDTGEVACDHYNRYAEDAKVMQQVGAKAYRLSISWPRVIPNGIGHVNEKGIEFYDKLVDALLDVDIQPWVTLFHWDFPYELYCRGGWLNRDVAEQFGDYAGLMAKTLGDRVNNWFTINEPPVFVGLGHQTGEHAPGDQLGRREILRIAHNVLRSHGYAVQAIRAAGSDHKIGMANVSTLGIPASSSEADINAARTGTFDLKALQLWCHSLWLDPAIKGGYPDDYEAAFGADGAEIHDGDMETIHQPLDFMGFNCYHGPIFEANGSGGYRSVSSKPGDALTMMEWPVTPEVLYWGPKWLYERYQLPLYVTENGMANMDWVHADGKVHDPQRIDYLRRHLLAFRKAGEEGIPVAGYFQWSIMDNFEWAWGYSRRFGLVYVDYATQERILKDSAHWYRGVIESNGAALDI